MWNLPPQEVKPVHTHKNVPIRIHFKKVAIHCVKHQTSVKNGEKQVKMEHSGTFDKEFIAMVIVLLCQ